MQSLRHATPVGVAVALLLAACGTPAPAAAPHFARAGTELHLRLPPMERVMSAEGHHNEQHGSWSAAEGIAVLDWLHKVSAGGS